MHPNDSDMKNLRIILLLACFTCLAGMPRLYAQRGSASKTIQTTKLVGIQEEYRQTESFRLDAAYEMLVVPMVAQIEVLSQEKKTFRGTARPDIPDGLASNQYLINKTSSPIELERAFEIIKSEVIYDFCAETNADVITLPQFKIKQAMVEERNEDGEPILMPLEINGKYVVNVQATGFPAVYRNFRQGTAEDIWIKQSLKMGQGSNEDAKYRIVENNTRQK